MKFEVLWFPLKVSDRNESIFCTHDALRVEVSGGNMKYHVM